MDTDKLYHKSLIKLLEVNNLDVASFDAYSVKVLVDFLKASHQRFLNLSIPKIEQNFLMLVKYFEGNNELNTLFKLFLKFQVDLKQHLQIEEKTIFPYSEILYKASISKSMQAVLLVHFSDYSIADFADTHENNECYLTELIFLLSKRNELKNHPVYNILLKQICQLDNELKTHAWVEDNVLVDKVKQIENAISNFVKND